MSTPSLIYQPPPPPPPTYNLELESNIQNIDDNECFKWSIVRYLNPANHHPARITKADKDFAKKLDFKDIRFQ